MKTILQRLLRTTALAALAAGGFASIVGSGGGGGGGDPDPGNGGGPTNTPPTAVARVTGAAIAYAVTQLDSTGSSDADGRIATRQWAYGDGSTGSADSHVYKTAGTYTATLTVTDDKGDSAQASVNVTVAKCSAAGLADAALSPFPTMCVQTTAGEMVFEVFPQQAPLTTANFLKYVDDGFYSDTLIHRVVRNFVIQGGGFTAGLTPKPPTYAPIALESSNGLKNTQYTLAMARTDQPNSATSQFFVNLVDNPGLDFNEATSTAGYAVFGQVISGNAVVDALGNVATATVQGNANVPVQDVVVRGITRLP